jgi:hypothetical protein
MSLKKLREVHIDAGKAALNQGIKDLSRAITATLVV